MPNVLMYTSRRQRKREQLEFPGTHPYDVATPQDKKAKGVGKPEEPPRLPEEAGGGAPDF